MSGKEYPEPPEPNTCGGYYCSEEHGHIDCDLNPKIRACESPGLTMQGATVIEISDGHGGRCWKAAAEIGSIFGSEVSGGIEAYGRTKEEALERLETERRKLYESLWA